MKRFITDPSFWALFPDALIGVLAVERCNEATRFAPEQAAEVEALLREANEKALEQLDQSIPLSQNRPVAVWREAYQKFPTKKGVRCSIEALLKRVAKGEPVGSISPMVDITNAVSLKYLFPIGVEDMDAIKGDIHLGVMAGGEDFLPIGETEQKPPLAGELAYYDEAGVVCRCWNWRDGQRTQVTENTTCEFIAMECVDSERTKELSCALDELAELLERYMGAKIVAKEIVTCRTPELIVRE